MNVSSQICKFVRFNRINQSSLLSLQSIKRSFQKNALIPASCDGLTLGHSVLMPKLTHQNHFNKTPATEMQATTIDFAGHKAYCPNVCHNICDLDKMIDVSRLTSLRKKIIAPNMFNLNVVLPMSIVSYEDIELPASIKNEVTDPLPIIIEKKAHRMIKIRRKKMKKFKRKKWFKKMKNELQKINRIKVAKKEALFKAEIQSKLDEGYAFNPEHYSHERLNLINWKRPITSVRGRLAPQWVIDEHLEEKTRKALLKERIEECLKKIN